MRRTGASGLRLHERKLSIVAVFSTHQAYFPQVPLDLISHLRNGRQAGRGMCEYGSVNPEHCRYPWDLCSSCLHRTYGLAWRLSVTYACHTQTSSSREPKPDSALAQHLVHPDRQNGAALNRERSVHHAHALETIGLDADILPPKRQPARVSTQNRCREKKLRLLQMT